MRTKQKILPKQRIQPKLKIQPKQRIRLKKKIRRKKVIVFLIFNLIFAIFMAPFIIFRGPFEDLKVLAVGSIITSRHPQVVRAFLSEEKISEITKKFNSPGSGANINRLINVSDPSAGIVIEDIKGSAFKGKVMLIKNPKRIQVAVTKDIGETGQLLSSMVKESGAIAAINGGGFDDLNGRGNGAYPMGISVHNGEIVSNDSGNEAVEIIGLDKDGKLIGGKMTASEIKSKNIREAVSFWKTTLVKNGKRGDFIDGEWGVAPRSAIGQKEDGTIIFVVIDGRQLTWSIGAKLSDLYQIFLKYGAVNAYNLDGGSSTELVYNQKIINKPCDFFGERYIPTAFLVMP
jgi:exopolysaccharide biosynthesis protein